VLTGLTRLVLINAVYFKGPWLSPFDKAHTKPRPFYTDETNHVETPFMYKKSYFNYIDSKDLDAEAVELGYEVFIMLITLL
jgi:serine protease inhibitor